MSFIVKITTKCGILDMICPHSCRGCGRLGSVICERCKKDIATSKIRVDKCVACGYRDSLLGALVKEYKYESVRAIGNVLTEILDAKVPKYGVDTVIVPLPTIARHVRERGLDHTAILAKKLARRRGWKCERLLERAGQAVQVGADAKTRQEQAKVAYRLAGEIHGDVKYVLFDDVWTTGASMGAAEKLLREAGAKDVEKVVLVTGKQSKRQQR